MKRAISFALVFCLLVPFGICGVFAEDSIDPTALVGDWIEINSGDSVEITSDGWFNIVYAGAANSIGINTLWELNGDTLSIRMEAWGTKEFSVDDLGDTIRLISENAEVVRLEDYVLNADKLNVGDLVETDSVEFTLSDAGFSGFTEGGHLAPKDMTYMVASFEIKNNSKQEITLPGDLFFIVDYDGFRFSGEESESSYLYNSTRGEYHYTASGAGGGVTMTVPPLTSRNYTLYLPCAAVISEDTETPLLLYITVPTETGGKMFIYDIR